jgi:hypothetical protein
MGQKSLALALPRRAPLLGVWLAMLSLAIQCLVIQPHVDASYAPISAAAHVSVQAAPANHETQGVCVICQAVAAAGAFALSASPSLAFVERSILADAPVQQAKPSERVRSHDWQSRAPPQTI